MLEVWSQIRREHVQHVVHLPEEAVGVALLVNGILVLGDAVIVHSALAHKSVHKAHERYPRHAHVAGLDDNHILLCSGYCFQNWDLKVHQDKRAVCDLKAGVASPEERVDGPLNVVFKLPAHHSGELFAAARERVDALAIGHVAR